MERSSGEVDTRYFHRDHLGSVAILTDEAGNVVERLSYDAWGKRRHPNGQDDPAGALASQTTRGFTGHEQLDDVGLIHMNGRVYDPLLGRFGTPDPMTENPFSTQGWNRYSYVGNSPLNFTDPSGYCFMGCFWQKPFKALGKLLRKVPIIGQLLTITAGFICGPICSSITSAVVTGLASGDLGQALKAGLISAVTSAGMFGVGELTGGLSGAISNGGGGYTITPGTEAHLFNIAGHAAVGCLSSMASGGKCGPGALSGAAGSAAGPILANANLGAGGSLIAHSLVGGVASVAGGGKFGNGAVTAAYGYLYNEWWHLGKAFLGKDAEVTLLNHLQQANPGGDWQGGVTVRFSDGTWGFIDLLRGASNEIYEVKPFDGTDDGAAQLAKYAKEGGYQIGDLNNIFPMSSNVPSTGPWSTLGASYMYRPMDPGVVGWSLNNGGQMNLSQSGFVPWMVGQFLTRGRGGPPAPAR